MYEKLKRLIAGSLAVDPDELNMSADIQTLYKADSLDMMTIVQEVELEFGIKIKDKDLPNLKNGNDIYRYLKKELEE